MPGLKPHVATLRCFIYTATEVEAILAADILRSRCEEYLDAEDGDSVEVTQVLPMTTDVEPLEIIHILLRARNALIRTKIRQCYDLARTLDETTHQLKYRSESHIPPYDYTEMITVSEQIINHNLDPI